VNQDWAVGNHRLESSRCGHLVRDRGAPGRRARSTSIRPIPAMHPFRLLALGNKWARSPSRRSRSWAMARSPGRRPDHAKREEILAATRPALRGVAVPEWAQRCDRYDERAARDISIFLCLPGEARQRDIMQTCGRSCVPIPQSIESGAALHRGGRRGLARSRPPPRPRVRAASRLNGINRTRRSHRGKLKAGRRGASTSSRAQAGMTVRSCWRASRARARRMGGVPRPGRDQAVLEAKARALARSRTHQRRANDDECRSVVFGCRRTSRACERHGQGARPCRQRDGRHPDAANIAKGAPRGRPGLSIESRLDDKARSTR